MSSAEGNSNTRKYLNHSITRRQALKTGGLATMGLVFSKPVIETIRPIPAFAQYGPGGGGPDGGGDSGGGGGSPVVALQIAKLVGCRITEEGFGSAIAISGDTIVAGVAREDAVYVFERNFGGPNNWGQVATLTASDGVAGDFFGNSVSISGNTVVVGAPFDEIGGNIHQGSAYVFIKPSTGWTNSTENAKLTGSDSLRGDTFGNSVNISGDTIAVGARAHDIGRGAVYVFVKPLTGWANATQDAKLTASDTSGGDGLGTSVGISGDTIVAGAPGDDFPLNADRGSVYVFVKPSTGWADGNEVAKLTASDGVRFDNFGRSVAISGDTIAVAFPAANSFTGAVYVFVKPSTGWTSANEAAKLTASDGVAGEAWGHIVAVSGDTIIAGGAFQDTGGNVDQGSAYIFVKPSAGWTDATEDAKLTASDGEADDNLGLSVAISGDTVVAGAANDDFGRDDRFGSAYVFDKPLLGWMDKTEDKKFVGCPPITEFGAALLNNAAALSGDVIVIGSYKDDNQKGSVYIYERDFGGPDNWGQVAILTASDCEASDSFGGSVTISGDVIVVGAVRDDVGSNVDQGSAYVFIKPPNGWMNATEDAKLTASDGALTRDFGGSVGISGDTIAIGDRLRNGRRGAIYVFVKPPSGWADANEDAKLTASDGALSDLLGNSVSISGDTIVAGAGSHNGHTGAVYVFVKPSSGWTDATEDAKLTASDGVAGDVLGASVAVSGDTVLAGAPLAHIGGVSDQGAAYVFEKPPTGWTNKTEDAKLVSSDGATRDNFGGPVAISGDVIVIIAPLDNGFTGAAYLYGKPSIGWISNTEDFKFVASDGVAGDLFGFSAAIDGTTGVVTAPFHDALNTPDVGSAYVFDVV